MILKYLGCGWFMKQFIFNNQNIPKTNADKEQAQPCQNIIAMK